MGRLSHAQGNPGGAPGNLLAALSRYGRRTAFLGKVGEDAFGRLLLESLRRAGVQTRGIRLTSSAFTTLTFVTLDAAGDRSFSFARKPGADHPAPVGGGGPLPHPAQPSLPLRLPQPH